MVTISSNRIRTDKGVGVGSTVEELKAAYPALKLVKHSLLTDQYVIVGSKGQLVFDVAASTAPEAAWDKSKVGTVIWVYLENKGHLIFSIANTGLGGDVCATE